MEFFFFLFVGFIILSAIGDSTKKQKKNRARNINPALPLHPDRNDQGSTADVWQSDTEPADLTYKNNTYNVDYHTLKAAQKKRVKRQVKQSRLRKQKRSWSKPSFGQSTVAVDKNKDRAHGFENGRVRSVLDGRRVFGFLALIGLTLYILGKV